MQPIDRPSLPLRVPLLAAALLSFCLASGADAQTPPCGGLGHCGNIVKRIQTGVNTVPAADFQVKLCRNASGTNCPIQTTTNAAGYWSSNVTVQGYFDWYLFAWDPATSWGKPDYPVTYATNNCRIGYSGPCYQPWGTRSVYPLPLAPAILCPGSGGTGVSSELSEVTFTSAKDAERSAYTATYFLGLAVGYGNFNTVATAIDQTRIVLPPGALSPFTTYRMKVTALLSPTDASAYRDSAVVTFSTGYSNGVTPPPAVVVNQSACVPQPGASLASLLPRHPGQYEELSAFLAGGTLFDGCSGGTNAGAHLDGSPISPDTIFPVGSSEVTFRFTDPTGRLHTATQTVTVLRQGDLDLDGDIDLTDALLLQSMMVGNLTPGVAPFLAPASSADVNGDGRTDVYDVLLIQAYVVGNVSCLAP